MSEYERKLFAIIQDNNDPVRAILTAIEIFTSILEQCEGDQSPAAVSLLVSDEIAVA